MRYTQYLFKFVNMLFFIAIFLPMNYVLGASFNYLIPSFIIVVLILTFNCNKKIQCNPLVVFLLLFVFSVFVSILYGRNAQDIMTSPVLLFFFYLMLVGGNFIKRVDGFDKWIDVAIIFVVLTCFYFSFSDIANITIHGRNRGFGSGSVTSIIGLIIFTVGFEASLSKRISLIQCLFLIFSGLLIIVIIQARGPIISVFLIVLFALFKFSSFKHKITFSSLLIIFIIVGHNLFTFYYPDLYQLVLSRFEFSGDVESYSSGRAPTIFFVFEMMTKSVEAFFLGNGLGSLKEAVHENGLFFPHNDFLYVLYEVGVFGWVFFFYLFYKAIMNIQSTSFRLLIITTMLHTNFILFSYMLITILLIDKSGNLKSQSVSQ